MTTTSKKKLILITIIILIGVISISLLPAFIYNEYEHTFRNNFISIYQLGDKLDKDIDLRQASVVSDKTSEEDHVNIGKRIEATIASMQEHASSNQVVNDSQGKIPFLPKEYQKYHTGKTEAISKYQELLDELLLNKQNEHMLTDSFFLLLRLEDYVRNINDSEWWDNLGLLPDQILALGYNTEAMYANSHISKDLYDYMKATIAMLEFMSEESIAINETDSWDYFDISELKKYREQRGQNGNITTIVKQTLDTNKIKKEMFFEQYATNQEDLYRWSDYYNEHSLDTDPLSSALSIFMPQYPRIRTDNNQPPSLIPHSVPYGTETRTE